MVPFWQSLNIGEVLGYLGGFGLHVSNYLGDLSGDGETVSEAGQWTKSGTPLACLPFEAQECVQVNVL